MIYLASPYSHPDPFEREVRYIRACKVLVEQYIMKRRWAYSPIVHLHEVAKMAGGLPTDANTWWDYNSYMLMRSTELHILRIEGWEQSKGVLQEKAFFEKVLNRGDKIVFI